MAFIDCQNDFIDGALGVGYQKWADAYNYMEQELLDKDKFDEFVFTLDSHPKNHCSFKDQGGPWPVHCVKNEPGFELYWKFEKYMRDKDFIYTMLQKGLDPEKEEYGIDVLKFDKDEIDEVNIAGLCTDYCVKESAIMTAKAHPEVAIKVHLKGSAFITQETALSAIKEMEKVSNIELVY